MGSGLSGPHLFAYRLAKELGVWDVEGMLDEMTWRQFIGWMRYHAVEPFGEGRADMRMAIVATLIANANRDPKKRPKPYAPKDFMLFEKPAQRYQPITDPGKWREMTIAMRTAFGEREGAS